MNEESLFHAALVKPSLLERLAFLDGACTGKPELRAAMDALLAAHDASGQFLEPQVGEPAAVESKSDRPTLEATIVQTPKPAASLPGFPATSEYDASAKPDALIAGRYTLQEKIGEGGMGEVWVAKQTEPVKRKVALKLIKTGMDSKAVIQRFEQERQALAMMDHPNIAKVLDGGLTPIGQPFFVMELVNGLPLNKFCDEARLTTNDRLELFVSICQAVQHAHQKGIVHRDLKPANILVTIIDGKPVPKVIDFGVAKATGGKLIDESMATQFGAVVGTLEYMSPEQASFTGVDIDTRADVYSLGVILYEMLTGLRPIDAKRLKKAALTEMIRIIQEEEPSKPSTRLSTDNALPSTAALRQIEPRKLMALLRGDLDWVVMKCLEKHRERRYETANALARDVQRYLDGEAVEACPPSVGYRARKFLKRNRGPAIAASFVLLALLAGFIGTAWGLIRADRALLAEAAQRRIAVEQRKKAEDSEKIAKDQRSRAEMREEQAIDAVKKFRDAVANNPELKNNPALDSLRKTLLKEPLAFFKALRDRLHVDHDTRPESLARLADASNDLGILTEEIGDKQDALVAYGESLAVRQKLVEASPSDVKRKLDLAGIHYNIGMLLGDTGKRAEALKEFKTALAIQERLAVTNPKNDRIQSCLADSYNNIGNVFSGTGKPAEAIKAYESALAVGQRLADANPTASGYQSQLAHNYSNIGSLLIETGRPADSLKAYESALAICQKLVDAKPTDQTFQTDLAHTHYCIGNLLRVTGKPEKALKSYESALAIRQRLADANRSNTKFQSDVADSHVSIGLLGSESGQRAEALKAYATALEILQKLADANPNVTTFQRHIGTIHNNTGILLYESGKFEESGRSYEAALTIRRKLVDANPDVTEFQSDLSSTYSNRGGLEGESGKPSEAMKDYESSLAISRKLAEEHPEWPDFANSIGRTLHNLASLDLKAKRYEAARSRLNQAVEWERKALGSNPSHPVYRQHLAKHLNNLFIASRNLGDSEGMAKADLELAKLRDSDPSIIALDARLAAIIKGDQQPKDNADRLILARRSYNKSLHATAARLWSEAVAADSTLGDDRQAQHLYNAACSAVLTASGKAIDHASPDETAKTRLRKQAFEWLESELSAWKSGTEAVGNELLAKTLAHWKEDPDLAPIRDEKELAKLPETERLEWQALWHEVEVLLANANHR